MLKNMVALNLLRVNKLTGEWEMFEQFKTWVYPNPNPNPVSVAASVPVAAAVPVAPAVPAAF